MIHVLEFLSAYPAWLVIVIGIMAIYMTVTTIGWIKELWKKRQSFRQSAVHEGEVQQALLDQEQIAKEEREARIKLLEENLAELTTLSKEQKKEIKMLINSDKLSTKAWIKEQHEKWISLQCIDSQSLELICDRFEIYKEEGGNSWAEKLVEEIKALPVVVVIPVRSDEE